MISIICGHPGIDHSIQDRNVEQNFEHLYVSCRIVSSKQDQKKKKTCPCEPLLLHCLFTFLSISQVMAIYKALSHYTLYTSNGPRVFPFQLNANLRQTFRLHCIIKRRGLYCWLSLCPSVTHRLSKLKTFMTTALQKE